MADTVFAIDDITQGKTVYLLCSSVRLVALVRYALKFSAPGLSPVLIESRTSWCSSAAAPLSPRVRP